MQATYQRNVLNILNTITLQNVLNMHKYYSFTVTHWQGFVKINEVSNHRKNDTSTDNKDTLDNFAEKLSQEKKFKWKTFHSNNKILDTARDSVELSQQLLNKTNNSSSDSIVTSELWFDEDVHKIMHNCQIQSQPSDQSPSAEIHRTIATGVIITSTDEISVFDNEKHIHNIYLAGEKWDRGHYEDALNLFWEVLTDHIYLHHRIQRVLIALMTNTIAKKGEAVLVLITNFSKQIARIHGDYTFLSCVWECCFLSEWHSDNEIASSLLDEFPELRKRVKMKVLFITNVSLTSHKVDVTQRLFEVLLKNNMKLEYQLVLRSLFDYACSVKDEYACFAIVQSCYDMDVTLTKEQKNKFLHLFYPGVPEAAKPQVKTWRMEPPQFTFKF